MSSVQGVGGTPRDAEEAIAAALHAEDCYRYKEPFDICPYSDEHTTLGGSVVAALSAAGWQIVRRADPRTPLLVDNSYKRGVADERARCIAAVEALAQRATGFNTEAEAGNAAALAALRSNEGAAAREDAT